MRDPLNAFNVIAMRRTDTHSLKSFVLFFETIDTVSAISTTMLHLLFCLPLFFVFQYHNLEQSSDIKLELL